jgi:integrase
MGKVHLTQTMIQKAEIKDARYTIRDDTPGLILRVGSSGSKVFYADYYGADGKRSLHKIGSADVLTVAQAREATKDLLARVTLGEDVREKPVGLTLGEYLEGDYFRWVAANRKSGENTIAMLKAMFGFLWDTRIDDIDPIQIDRWRVEKIQSVKAASINRELGALKSALNWGVKRGILEVHPLARLERLQERDSKTIVRYLSPEERARLMAALDEHEANLKRGRGSHNKWLEERGKELMPDVFDYLKPMVIVSLNTGIRRGSLFGLLWSDVDLDGRVLTLRGEEGKSGKTNHVPLNDAAFRALSEWRNSSGGDGLVFPSPRTGKRMGDCKKAWKTLMKKASIENFRWHDMRHDFASQLVMKGVDLNTVRELMGHADLKMTLRYAHLAPEAKVKAIGVLDGV